MLWFESPMLCSEISKLCCVIVYVVKYMVELTVLECEKACAIQNKSFIFKFLYPIHCTVVSRHNIELIINI